MKRFLVVACAVLLFLSLFLGYGAMDSIRNGNGFLFVSSDTPTMTFTNTATCTATMTMTPTATETEYISPTYTPYPSLTAYPTNTFYPTLTPYSTNTPYPTYTLIPTFDKKGFEKNFIAAATASFRETEIAEMTETAFAVWNSEWTDGMRIDDLVFISEGNERFWVQMSEVSETAFFGIEKGTNIPVSSVSCEEAAAYCESIGMELPTQKQWQILASRNRQEKDEMNVDGILNGARAVEHPEFPWDIYGNLWEWTSTGEGYQNVICGGSYRTDIRDLETRPFALVPFDGKYEDVGFRCVLNDTK